MRYSGGRWIAVSEDAIERAWRQAATGGLLMVHDWKDRARWFAPGRQAQP